MDDDVADRPVEAIGATGRLDQAVCVAQAVGLAADDAPVPFEVLDEVRVGVHGSKLPVAWRRSCGTSTRTSPISTTVGSARCPPRWRRHTPVGSTAFMTIRPGSSPASGRRRSTKPGPCSPVSSARTPRRSPSCPMPRRASTLLSVTTGRGFDRATRSSSPITSTTRASMLRRRSHVIPAPGWCAQRSRFRSWRRRRRPRRSSSGSAIGRGWR